MAVDERCSILGGVGRRELVARAKRIQATRRARQFCFADAGFLFGEPGYDALLALYVAECERGCVSVSSACGASGVPPTTGLRWITTMEAKGLIRREADPFDRRRFFLRLTNRAFGEMEAFLARV